MRVLTLLLSLGLAGAVYGGDAWQQLADQGAAAGLDNQRFDGLVERCRKAGLSPESTRTITAGLLRACTNRWPTESVYTKIDEGLAKQAGADRISQAVDIRVRCLERANALVESSRGQDQRGRPALIATCGHALESGVPESGITRLLTNPNAARPGRLMGAIEGLEALQAQRFPAADAQRLMSDALARGLRRNEMLQAVDRALRKQEEGMDSASITLERDE